MRTLRVLLDLKMPRMGGLELLGRFHSELQQLGDRWAQAGA